MTGLVGFLRDLLVAGLYALGIVIVWGMSLIVLVGAVAMARVVWERRLPPPSGPRGVVKP